MPLTDDVRDDLRAALIDRLDETHRALSDALDRDPNNKERAALCRRAAADFAAIYLHQAGELVGVPHFRSVLVAQQHLKRAGIVEDPHMAGLIGSSRSMSEIASIFERGHSTVDHGRLHYALTVAQHGTHSAMVAILFGDPAIEAHATESYKRAVEMVAEIEARIAAAEADKVVDLHPATDMEAAD